MKHYVFLDADGTVDPLLHVIVRAPTGVTYAHQCGGHHNEERTAEGFLIPLGGFQHQAPEIVDRLRGFFAKEFRGYPDRDVWSDATKRKLSSLISEIPCFFRAENKDDDTIHFLKLDELAEECTEGWVPVLTPYGQGILIFKNCD